MSISLSLLFCGKTQRGAMSLYNWDVALEVRHHCQGCEDSLYSLRILPLTFLMGFELNCDYSHRQHLLNSGGQAGRDLGIGAV